MERKPAKKPLRRIPPTGRIGVPRPDARALEGKSEKEQRSEDNKPDLEKWHETKTH